jgi:hypothetical protein
MAELYEADKEIRTIMVDLITRFHPDLAVIEPEIALLFKGGNAAPAGDEEAAPAPTKELGKTGKAPPILKAITGKDWKFVITLSQDGWMQLNDAQRVALLDHHLCGCRVTEDTEKHTYKYTVARPDVAFYKGEVERHGVWRTSGAPPTAKLVEQIFGEEPEGDVPSASSLEE